MDNKEIKKSGKAEKGIVIGIVSLITVLIAALIFAFIIPIGSDIDSSFENAHFYVKDLVHYRNYYEYMNSPDIPESEKEKLPERPVFTKLEDIPINLQDAVIAVEDKNFYSHSGVNLLESLKSLYSDKANSGTIDEQLSGILIGESDKYREFTRLITAKKIDSEFTKDQILEFYLNLAYYGNGTLGIYEASTLYFGKEPKDLSLTESVVLAGIISNPYEYAPFILFEPDKVLPGDIVVKSEKIDGKEHSAVFNPKSVERANHVIDLMIEQGYINSNSKKLSEKELIKMLSNQHNE